MQELMNDILAEINAFDDAIRFPLYITHNEMHQIQNTIMALSPDIQERISELNAPDQRTLYNWLVNEVEI